MKTLGIWMLFIQDIVPGNTRKAFSDTGHFLRIRQWGGHLQKGTILYRVWRSEMIDSLLVTKSLVWYRI
jgi:hypothetical protein